MLFLNIDCLNFMLCSVDYLYSSCDGEPMVNAY